MTMRFIPSVNPGDSVGSKPTFPVNAQVRGDFLYLRDANGNKISGRSVSDGDEITVLKVDHGKQLALVQYPAGSIYRQGYVTNVTSIIKYKNEYNWSNGSTSEIVYDLDKKTQIGSLNPREKATILYKVDGMTALVYDTSKGKMTKSGLVHYAGSGGSDGGDVGGVTPGDSVGSKPTFPVNAQVVGDDLYLRDANGNQISGRIVSNGDKITVLDVGYTKQLALVQYPAGNVYRQGYVTNATKLIRYFRQGEWINGSTTEVVLDENGGSLGSISPYEAATPLYEKNGMIHVVYNTSKGPNTKSGYVRYEGLGKLPDTNIQIPTISHSQATVERYGTSERGRALNVYKIGNGSKVLFAGFAIHGWEDHWDNDGLALVKIANALIAKVGDYKAQNGLHGWTVYIAPCMNPDGVIVRGTKDGPGRCAVESRVDMNRCFPRGFSANYSARHYTGPEALGAPEAVALKNFIEKINRTADEMIVIDAHGWLGCTYGDSSIAQYFTNQFGFSHQGASGGGFFSYWAQGLQRTRAILLEYPRSTYSYNDVINGNYIGKTFNGIINVLKNNPNGDGGGNPGGDGGGNPSGDIVVGSKVKIIGTHWATGQLIPDWAKNTTHTVGKIDGNRALLQEVTSWIYLKDIVLADGGGNPGGDNSNEIFYDATGEIINVSSILNVRSGPGTSYNAIGTLHGGDRVTIIAKVRPLTEKLYWYKIKFGGETGYIRSDFVKIIASGVNEIPMDKIGTINASSTLNVRSGPGIIYDVIGSLNGGTRVKVLAKVRPLEEEFYWYKIEFGNVYGYVRSDFVYFDPNPIPPTTNEDTALKKAKELLKNVFKQVSWTGELEVNSPTTFAFWNCWVDFSVGLDAELEGESQITIKITDGNIDDSTLPGMLVKNGFDFIGLFSDAFNEFIGKLELELDNATLEISLDITEPSLNFKVSTPLYNNEENSFESNIFYNVKFRPSLKLFAEELIENVRKLMKIVDERIEDRLVSSAVALLVMAAIMFLPVAKIATWIVSVISLALSASAAVVANILNFIFKTPVPTKILPLSNDLFIE